MLKREKFKKEFFFRTSNKKFILQYIYQYPGGYHSADLGNLVYIPAGYFNKLTFINLNTKYQKQKFKNKIFYTNISI